MLRREWKPLFPKKTRRLHENRDPGTVFTLPHFARRSSPCWGCPPIPGSSVPAEGATGGEGESEGEGEGEGSRRDVCERVVGACPCGHAPHNRRASRRMPSGVQRIYLQGTRRTTSALLSSLPAPVTTGARLSSTIQPSLCMCVCVCLCASVCEQGL